MAARLRRKRGSSLAEGAVALLIVIPMLIAITYVVLEASHAYMIYAALQQAAQQAARALATYPVGQPPNFATYPLSTAQIQGALQQIQVPNVIADPGQFNPQFLGPSASPTSVVVTVTYTSGQYGLPVFPDADVLHLGTLFTLQGSASYQVN